MANFSLVQELQQGIIWFKGPPMVRYLDTDNDISSKNFKKAKVEDRTRVVFK